jgi:predicted O-methyltransferase YrrM
MDSFNILEVAAFIATMESAKFYEEHLLGCIVAETDLRLLELALAWRQRPGMILEFGVASGRTINHIASIVPDERVYGFDWFQGLPEHWRPGFTEGAFAQPVPQTRSNVTLINGLFEETLPAFVHDKGEDISLLHIDCDLYSSTRTIFEATKHRITPGSVIVFDEFFNYPGWKLHEFKAFSEFISEEKKAFEYMGFVPSHQQLCVRITG